MTEVGKSTMCCEKSEMPHDGCCPVCFAGPDEACINKRTENVVQTHKRRHPSPHTVIDLDRVAEDIQRQIGRPEWFRRHGSE